MSALIDQARTRAWLPAQGLPRPRLTLVRRTPEEAPRVPFVLLVVTVLALGLVGLLVLNTTLQRGAYVATDLREQSAALAVRQQNLEMQVATLQEPQRVAKAALRLGMVRNVNPVFLSLATGNVEGSPVVGNVADRPDVRRPGGGNASTRGKRSALVGGELVSLHGLYVVPSDQRRHHDRSGDQH